MITREHRLRIRILQFPKIHEFLRILKLSILKLIKFRLSHSSPPSSNKLFVANTALNCWTINSVMSTIQDLSTRQQFIILLQTLRITAASLSSPESETSTSGGSRISGKGTGWRVAEGHEGDGAWGGSAWSCAPSQKKTEI